MGVTTGYSYDGAGRRVKKEGSGVTTIFVYNALGQLIAEYSNNAPTGPLSRKYLTADHQGSTRVVTAQSQQVVARHDYLPFGELLGATIGPRTTGMGYSPQPDGLRQKFTAKERDNESGLDYFLARYYSSAQGRFTSVDPGNAGARPEHPQSWNGYAYTLNRPTVLSDPDGLWVRVCVDGVCEVISDPIAKQYLWNKEFQKQQGFHTKGDGNIYDTATGNIIGTYRNLGDDQWSDKQRAIVNEVAYQTSSAEIWFNVIIDSPGFRRKQKPSNLPSPRKVRVDMTEVMSGHTSTGGRYRQGAKNPNTNKLKDIFPDSMSENQIQEAIMDAYEHCERVQTQGERVKLRGTTRGGMIIEMWLNTTTNMIETAYPKGMAR